MSMKSRSCIAVIACGVMLAAGLPLLYWNWPREYDISFDASVADPAYPASGPVVLFDEAHLNSFGAGGGYKPFADLTRNDGYELRVLHKPVTARGLDGVGVFVVVLPRGANDANDDPAFTEAEVDAIEGWVRGGGSLLLVTDHWPYGVAAAPLARRFGVDMSGGFAEDPEHHESERGASHIIYSSDNGLLGDHAITRGRNDRERVERILTFTGQSLRGPPDAVPLLALSPSAIDRPPTAPRVERDGDDVRVHMVYGEPVSAEGRAQALALEVDGGRVVVLGEAGMLRASRSGGFDVGMNVPGYDNRRFALNVMHWLSRLSEAPASTAPPSSTAPSGRDAR